jgi:membrane peptidoglycan carboxypeptidase
VTRARIRALAIAFARAAGLALAVFAVALAALWATTDLDLARFVRPDDALTITDRHGAPLRYQRAGGQDRRWVELDAISPHLIDAVIAVEDHRFYEHEGVDALAIARAALTSWWPGRRVSGASTSTQQLVKSVYGRPRGLADKPI